MEEFQEVPGHPRFRFVSTTSGDFLQRGNGLTIETDDISPEALRDIALENAEEIFKRTMGYKAVYLARITPHGESTLPLSPRGVQQDRLSHHHDNFTSIDPEYASLWEALMTAQFMPTLRTHVHTEDPALSGVWLGSRRRVQLDPPYFSDSPLYHG